MKVAVLLLCLLCLFAADSSSQTIWNTPLDSKIRFYQTTDFGVVLAATERSLYAIDGESGQRIWRREVGSISETSITPVPETDLVLFSRDLGSKSRIEAVDVITGSTIWQSDKVKGDVMQLAVDPANDLIAIVMVKNARGIGSLKRKPVLHVLQMSSGDELWKRDFDNEIEMMPSRFGDVSGDIDFTLDNYRAPLLLDGRLFLFYKGATSYDARTGKEKEREKFKINEDGLALTEADPVFNDTHVFVSGRGRVRAVNRRTGNVDWKADDLGIAAEMAVVGNVLYIRTGGQFTRLKDGETENKGPYGISAIDTRSGKTQWRYKGADKGLTNFVFGDVNTIALADRDDLITVDTANGKVRDKVEHDIEKAQFVTVNENGRYVVGGRDEIAAFSIPNCKLAIEARQGKCPPTVGEWRVRHKAPARGVLRIVAGVALRASAMYFRYGGIATSVLSAARGGLSLLSAANSLRWSGLKTRFGSFDLTTLASNSAQNYVTRRIFAYGSIGRVPDIARRFSGLQITLPNATDIRGQIIGRAIDRVTPTQMEVRESIFERVDPVRQIERLSSFLLRKQRLAELRSNHMYFFTDLPKPYDRKGLIGVNINNGRDSRFVVIGDPDPQFVADETTSTVISADGNRLQAFGIISPR